jgi:hypothetical protein
MTDQIGKRESLRARAIQQSTGAAAEDDPPAQGWQGGSLAARAAALIAGKADAGPDPEEGKADEDPVDDEGAEPGRAVPDDGADEDPVDDEDGGDEAPAQGELLTADDAAKRLGLTRQQFNALQVQVGAESMTLGELKAKLPEVLKLDKGRAELDDDRGTWELERVASYRNLSAIIDALPKNAMTAGLLRQLEAQHENTRARELESLHFARPRWSDPNYATSAREKMHAVAKEYGFSRVELDGVLDHRQVLLLQDFADLREKVRASRDTARKLAEGGADRPSGQRGAAAAGPSVNGSGPRRASQKPTQEATARQAGSIMRRR